MNGFLTGSGHLSSYTLDYSGFISNMSSYRQGILTYWNVNDDCDGVEYDIGVHTIFIKKTQTCYEAFNKNQTDSTIVGTEYATILSMMNTSNDVSLGNKQFVTGYVFNN